MFRPEMPHKAIINISFSIYPIDQSGDLGHPVPRQQLQKDELKHKLLDVKGSSYEECVINLKEMLDRILSCKS